jgi:hypothetical protein
MVSLENAASDDSTFEVSDIWRNPGETGDNNDGAIDRLRSGEACRGEAEPTFCDLWPPVRTLYDALKSIPPLSTFGADCWNWFGKCLSTLIVSALGSSGLRISQIFFTIDTSRIRVTIWPHIAHVEFGGILVSASSSDSG